MSDARHRPSESSVVRLRLRPSALRRLLIVALALVVLSAVALFVVGQWLGGGQVRAAVEARLTATLGQPVSIGRLGVTLGPRFALTGGNIRIGETHVQAPAIHVERIRVLPRLRALLDREVVVERIDLDGFSVSLLQDEHGRWHVPSAVPAPTQGGTGAVIERVRVTDGRVRVFDRTAGGSIDERASIDDLDADVTVEPDGLRLAPIAARIGTATISGEAHTTPRGAHLQFGSRDIADADLPAFLRLLGSVRPEFLRLKEPASASVTVDIDRASARLSGKGTVTAPQVLLEPLHLSAFEAPFAIDGSRLQFSPASFRMYGGAHRGTATIQLAGTPPAWTVDSRMTGLNVGQFLAALTGRDQRVDGTAAATAALRGRVGEPLDETVRGRLQLTIVDGVVRQFPLLAAINRAIRLTEGDANDTRFERLSATFAIAQGQGTTDDLRLEAGHVRVEAAGRIGADRSLELRGAATVDAERAGAAVASVREFARLRNSRGEIEVPLTISGSLDAPSFGIDLSTAVRKGLADELRRRLRKFIRPPEP